MALNPIIASVQEDVRAKGMCGEVFVNEEGDDAMCILPAPCEEHSEPSPTESEVERLREALREIEAGSPPNSWKWRDPMGYDHFGHGDHGHPDFVDDVDSSNCGDLHAHGRAVGRWEAAKIARCALEDTDD